MTGMDDLVTWFRAALDRQEAALIAYRDHRAGLTPCDNLDEDDSCDEHIRTARASEYRDVEFGLAEVEAKRRILDLHQATEGQHPDFCGHDMYELPCPTLRLLAFPYADRPGYLPAWRPDGS